MAQEAAPGAAQAEARAEAQQAAAGAAVQDDRLLALLQTMGDIQRQQADYLRQRRDGEREACFKIHRSIPKTTAEGAAGLLDEVDAFEATFARTNPQSAKDWATTFDDALEGKAKSWRDCCILCDPGRRIHEATLVVGATANDYMNYC